MDSSREHIYVKNTHTNTTTKRETNSNFLSECEEPLQHSQKKIEDENYRPTQHFYPIGLSTHGFYPPPWTTMNYMYFDLLRQLSLENELRSSLSKIDSRFDSKFVTEIQSKHKCCKDGNCNERKFNHKLCRGEDFTESCSQLCTFCLPKFNCICGHFKAEKEVFPVLLRDKEPCKCCQCTSDSPSAIQKFCYVPVNCCHCHCQKITHPCCSASQKCCKNLQEPSVNTSEQKNIKTHQTCLNLEKANQLSGACKESDSDPRIETVLTDKKALINDSPIKKESIKVSTDTDLEDNCGYMPSFLGGTGDEEDKHPRGHPSKVYVPQAQGTAYFLPVSSLNTK